MKTSDSGSGAGKVSEGLGLLSTIISSLSFYKNESSLCCDDFFAESK